MQQQRNFDQALLAERRERERVEQLLEEKTRDLVKLKRSYDAIVKELHEAKTKQPPGGISQSSSLLTRASQNCDCLNGTSCETEGLKTEVTDLRKRIKQLEEKVNTLTLEKRELKDSHQRLLRTSSDHSMSDECAKLREQLDEYKMLLQEAERVAAMHDRTITDLRQQLQTQDDETDSIVVLKHQLHVYRIDFEAERRAREEKHDEVEWLRGQLDQLQLRCQQLSSSDPQLQLAANAKQGNVAAPWEQKRLSAISPTATFPPSLREQPRPQPHVQPIHTLQTQSSSTELLSCPVCNMEVPDYDSLNVHVNECVDSKGSA